MLKNWLIYTLMCIIIIAMMPIILICGIFAALLYGVFVIIQTVVEIFTPKN